MLASFFPFEQLTWLWPIAGSALVMLVLRAGFSKADERYEQKEAHNADVKRLTESDEKIGRDREKLLAELKESDSKSDRRVDKLETDLLGQVGEVRRSVQELGNSVNASTISQTKDMGIVHGQLAILIKSKED